MIHHNLKPRNNDGSQDSLGLRDDKYDSMLSVPNSVPSVQLSGVSDAINKARKLEDNIDVNDFEIDNSVSIVSLQSPYEPRISSSSVEVDPLMVPQEQEVVHGSFSPYDSGQVKKAGELAGVLLDTKRTFLAENNVVDPTARADETTTNSKQPTKVVSRATYVRAERVKSTLAFKYLMIERGCSNYDSEIKYPGIEGVYNPLQIIRNRRIRAKYHEYPKPLTFKATPLASTVFSSKNLDRRRKPRRFLWAVDLNELISEYSWRINHIHEMKKPTGELWFPPTESNYHYKSGAGHRLHDKLFMDEEYPDSTSNLSAKSKDDEKEEDVHTPGRRDRLKKRMKRRLKYSVDSRSTGSSESNEGLHDAFIYKFHRKKPDKTIEPVPSTTSGPLPGTSGPGSGSMTRISTPMQKHQFDPDTSGIVTPGSSAGDLLTNVKINPIDQRRLSFEDSEMMDPEPQQQPKQEPEFTNDVAISLIDGQLTKISEHELYLKNSTFIKLHFLKDIYPHLFKSTCKKIEMMTTESIPRLKETIVEVNDDVIPTYENLCAVLLSEIRRVVHVINDDYSIRVDNLLTGSDRLIGEINTSMSLELRKMDEKLDKLNSSLFGSNFRQLEFGDSKLEMNDSGNYKMLYFVLENSIVILLRLIWVVANVFNSVMWVLRLVWRVVKFVLF